MLPDRQPERLAVRREASPRPALVVAAPRLRHDGDERPVHDARHLTDDGSAAEIRLDGVRYVLRITRQGKLILTK